MIETAKHVNEADIKNTQCSKDTSTFNQETIVIKTDFSATVDLGAKVKDNCSEGNHAVLHIFLVYHNAQEYKVSATGKA